MAAEYFDGRVLYWRSRERSASFEARDRYAVLADEAEASAAHFRARDPSPPLSEPREEPVK